RAAGRRPAALWSRVLLAARRRVHALARRPAAASRRSRGRLGRHRHLAQGGTRMIGLTSPTHLALLLLIALCLFRAKRLPQIRRSLGSGMREFKESVTHQALEETTEQKKTD